MKRAHDISNTARNELVITFPNGKILFGTSGNDSAERTLRTGPITLPWGVGMSRVTCYEHGGKRWTFSLAGLQLAGAKVWEDER